MRSSIERDERMVRGATRIRLTNKKSLHDAQRTASLTLVGQLVLQV